MKKLMAAAFAISLTGSALAAGTIGFEFGSTWFHPNYNDNGSGANWSSQGQTFALNWAVDSDLWIGAYTESLTLNDGYGNSYPWAVQALQISKGIVKNVVVGLNLGTVWDDAYNNDATGALTDVFGAVTILSGSGDKVSGNLKATIAARWADTEWQNGEAWSGYTYGISAGISF